MASALADLTDQSTASHRLTVFYKNLSKMGVATVKQCPIREFMLEDCDIPETTRLGERGMNTAAVADEMNRVASVVVPFTDIEINSNMGFTSWLRGGIQNRRKMLEGHEYLSEQRGIEVIYRPGLNLFQRTWRDKESGRRATDKL